MMKITVAMMLGLLVYIYAGYPLLLWLAARRRLVRYPEVALPPVSLIITARNEERAMRAKLENLRTWAFPAERLQVLLVSDGSTDKTVDVFRNAMRQWETQGAAPEWTVVELPVQKGKSEAQNEAVLQARHELLVFSDAGALFEPEALARLVAPFASPSVGCVTGKPVYRNAQEPGAAASEGAYFRYESWIRSMESRAGVLAMGSGCILAIRRELFQPLRRTEGEDWALCLRTLELGYHVVQVDDAIASEEVVTSSAGLFRTKVRIISKDFLTLWQRRRLLNPWSYGKSALALWSHKFLRWFSFLWMGIALISSGILGAKDHGFALLFLAQAGFYSLALLGAWAESRKHASPGRLLATPYNFCVVQAAAAMGIWKALTGRSEAIWQPIREPAITKDLS